MTRTASGMSMLLGAASLNIKTVVKNLDDFLLKPLGESYFQWNMQFLEDVLDVPVMNKYFMVQAPANAGQVDSSPTTEDPPAEENFVPPFEGAALVPSDDAEELSVDNSGASIVIDNPTLGGYR